MISSNFRSRESVRFFQEIFLISCKANLMKETKCYFREKFLNKLSIYVINLPPVSSGVCLDAGGGVAVVDCILVEKFWLRSS